MSYLAATASSVGIAVTLTKGVPKLNVSAATKASLGRMVVGDSDKLSTKLTRSPAIRISCHSRMREHCRYALQGDARRDSGDDE